MSQELKLKSFVSWGDFSKYIVNSIFRKTLQAHQYKSESNIAAKQKKPVLICYRFSYSGVKSLQFLKSCICKIKVNCKNDQPVVFKILYDFCKIEFFSNAKDITPIILINLLLCTSSRVLALVQIMQEKSKEHYMNDVLKTHRVIKKALWKITWTSVLKCSTYLILPI